MKGNLIALGMKLFGLGWLWEKIDGMKTYLGASVEILSGLGGVLMSASALVASFNETTHNLGDVINFVQGQIAHPSAPAIAITISWGAVVHGWGVMAKKHSDDKKHAELLTAAAPVVAEVMAPVADAPKA